MHLLAQRPQLGDRADAVAVGQAVVEEQHVGLRAPHEGAGLLQAPGDADGGEVRLGVEHHRQAGGQHLVVVDHEHARG